MEVDTTGLRTEGSRSVRSDTELGTTERVRLEQYEKIIEKGRQTFIEVGSALMSIRDSRLYRATHGTFEEYCRERWGWSASRSRQIIAAAEVAERVESVTTVTPGNERQVRPLAALPPEQQAEAWEEAVRTAPDGKVTERHVRGVVDSRKLGAPEEQPEAVVDHQPEEGSAGHPCAAEPEILVPKFSMDFFEKYVGTMLRSTPSVAARRMCLQAMIGYLRMRLGKLPRKARAA